MEPRGSLPHSKCPPAVILRQTSPVHAPHPNSWRSILILSSHLRRGLSRCLFPSGFPHQNPAYTSPVPHTSYDFTTNPFPGRTTEKRKPQRAQMTTAINFFHSKTIKKGTTSKHQTLKHAGSKTWQFLFIHWMFGYFILSIFFTIRYGNDKRYLCSPCIRNCVLRAASLSSLWRSDDRGTHPPAKLMGMMACFIYLGCCSKYFF